NVGAQMWHLGASGHGQPSQLGDAPPAAVLRLGRGYRGQWPSAWCPRRGLRSSALIIHKTRISSCASVLAFDCFAQLLGEQETPACALRPVPSLIVRATMTLISYLPCASLAARRWRARG